MCELQESVDMNEVARMRSIDVDPSPHGAQRGIMDCSVAAHSAEEKSIWTEGGNSACEAGNENNCSTATAVDLRDLCIESW